jgi:hypothetical protein
MWVFFKVSVKWRSHNQGSELCPPERRTKLGVASRSTSFRPIRSELIKRDSRTVIYIQRSSNNPASEVADCLAVQLEQS